MEGEQDEAIEGLEKIFDESMKCDHCGHIHGDYPNPVTALTLVGRTDLPVECRNHAEIAYRAMLIQANTTASQQALEESLRPLLSRIGVQAGVYERIAVALEKRAKAKEVGFWDTDRAMEMGQQLAIATISGLEAIPRIADALERIEKQQHGSITITGIVKPISPPTCPQCKRTGEHDMNEDGEGGVNPFWWCESCQLKYDESGYSELPAGEKPVGCWNRDHSDPMVCVECQEDYLSGWCMNFRKYRKRLLIRGTSELMEDHRKRYPAGSLSVCPECGDGATWDAEASMWVCQNKDCSPKVVPKDALVKMVVKSDPTGCATKNKVHRDCNKCDFTYRDICCITYRRHTNAFLVGGKSNNVVIDAPPEKENETQPTQEDPYAPANLLSRKDCHGYPDDCVACDHREECKEEEFNALISRRRRTGLSVDRSASAPVMGDSK